MVAHEVQNSCEIWPHLIQMTCESKAPRNDVSHSVQVNDSFPPTNSSESEESCREIGSESVELSDTVIFFFRSTSRGRPKKKCDEFHRFLYVTISFSLVL